MYMYNFDGAEFGIPTLVWRQTQMRVHLPMTIQALPGANGPLPNGPLAPSEFLGPQGISQKLLNTTYYPYIKHIHTYYMQIYTDSVGLTRVDSVAFLTPALLGRTLEAPIPKMSGLVRNTYILSLHFSSMFPCTME